VILNGCPRASRRLNPARPAVLAAELLGRVRAELPVIGGLGERDQVLVAAWLTGLRSARTRRAYAGDVVAWLGY
jgi:integrase/recombinase XerD